MPRVNGSSAKDEVRDLKAKPSEMRLQYQVISKITGYHILWMSPLKTKNRAK